MTGYYVRVQRGGRFQSLEITELTPEEFDRLAEASPPEAGWMWAKALAKWIHQNVCEATQNNGGG